MRVISYIISLLLASIALLYPSSARTKTIPVGPNEIYKTLTAAAAQAVPGDTILFHAGIYPGGEQLVHFAGKPDQPIVLMNRDRDTVIIRGGEAGWLLRHAAWLQVRGIIFEQQTGNGFNIDDGGHVDQPSHHITFSLCTFRHIQASGNNDLLKLSGLDHFEIRDCVFLYGAQGGSAIDMVGCHHGIITGCRFEHMGSNAVQVKGGSRFIRIERNYFNHAGERTLNLGGSTGLAFFRPQDAAFEAADLQVYANVIIGSLSPINYVGCTRVEVINNTIYQPEKWVVRILQENKDARFIACSNNTFRNNIIYHDNRVSNDCNTGAGTEPDSFHFSHNLWYHAQDRQWRGPMNIPVTDSGSIIGKDPLFRNAAQHDFSIPAHSPAAQRGYTTNDPVYDLAGRLFSKTRSIGCYEVSLPGSIPRGKQ